MGALTKEQYDQFWRDGFLVVEDVVDSELLKSLQHQFASWVDESREHHEAYGDTLDGRPRFDLESGHNAEAPQLRRGNAPVEVALPASTRPLGADIGATPTQSLPAWGFGIWQTKEG